MCALVAHVIVPSKRGTLLNQNNTTTYPGKGTVTAIEISPRAGFDVLLKNPHHESMHGSLSGEVEVPGQRRREIVNRDHGILPPQYLAKFHAAALISSAGGQQAFRDEVDLSCTAAAFGPEFQL